MRSERTFEAGSHAIVDTQLILGGPEGTNVRINCSPTPVRAVARRPGVTTLTTVQTSSRLLWNTSLPAAVPARDRAHRLAQRSAPVPVSSV